MSATAPARFTFDLDLGSKAESQRLIGQTELDRLLAEAERKGFERGKREATEADETKAARAVAEAATQLAGRATEIATASDAAQVQLIEDAARLAVGTARKLAAHLIARQPLGEIEALMDECLAGLGNVPHLVMRCHPDLADAVKAAAENRIAQSGFAGRLVVMGEPDIMLGDVRFEWNEGGMVRDLGHLSAEIDARLATFIQSRQTGETKG